MKSLIKYSIIIKEYIDFLNKNKYPAKSLLSTDNIHIALGYILEFLSTKHIYLVVDNYNYVIFTDIEQPFAKDFILYETDNDDYDDSDSILNMYKHAINKTFEIINIPF